MFEYLEGKIAEITPAFAVLDVGGVGYFINISLTTFSEVKALEKAKLYIHQAIREDAHLLFGFSKKDERTLFRMLISVSGVGASTAQMMLSSINPAELSQSIMNGDVQQLKSIKGIGVKTAQRIIVELKDKVGKESLSEDFFAEQDNTLQQEAFSALLALGFQKNTVEKVVKKILTQNQNLTVEELIKEALKNL
jgi:Holliday junction DNA helicase RuvA